MSNLSFTEIKNQRTLCVKLLSLLLYKNDVVSNITFLIYLGQFILVSNNLEKNNKYYVGAGVVRDVSKDNNLTALLSLRNSLVHYNSTLMNTCVNIVRKIKPEDYVNSEYYAYMSYLSEINWKELKDFYNKI